MQDITISAVKARARTLIAHLAKSGAHFTMPDALEALSAAENRSDWNRYQAAIKSARNPAGAASAYPPHTVLACNPGMGGFSVTEVIFAYEAQESSTFPLYIQLGPIEFPNADLIDHAGIVFLTWKDDKMNGFSDSNPDIRGIVVNVPALVGSDASSSYQKEVYEAALKEILLVVSGWGADILSRVGTVTVSDFDLAEKPSSSFYDTEFPQFMHSIRRHGGKPRLLVLTMSSLSKASLYRSVDEYEIITMCGSFSVHFADSPLPVLNVPNPLDDETRNHGQLFRFAKHDVRDAAMFIGAIKKSYFRAKLAIQTPFSTFLQKHVLDGIDLAERKRSEGKHKKGVAVNVWFDGQGIEHSAIEGALKDREILQLKRSARRGFVEYVRVLVVDQQAQETLLSEIKTLCQPLGLNPGFSSEDII